MSATAEKPLRIGEVAELTGTTPRTIRYYEEIGLLPGSVQRGQGKHRCYTEADVDRVREIVRLRDLLGLSLDQLSKLLAAEAARAGLRREWTQAGNAPERRRIIDEALGHIAIQLELVRGRRHQLEQLEAELVDRERLLHQRIREKWPRRGARDAREEQDCDRQRSNSGAAVR
jgi:MerR family transcriptional regulator, repressor of the yfmOP operon